VRKYRGVAQPGSAPALGAGGRQFKSDRPDQSKTSRDFRKLQVYPIGSFEPARGVVITTLTSPVQLDFRHTSRVLPVNNVYGV
jgi:hypothetical protein